MSNTRLRGLRAVDWALIAAVVGAVLPVAAAAVARVGSHWRAAGDEAMIARLSHDVFSSHTPLLGMPSTIAAGIDVTGGGTPHHLGPMLFWLFAIPDRLSGSSPAALTITIALVNIASIVAVAWQVRRRAGSSAAIVAMLGVTVMLWSVGRDLTVQIWNPYVALLPLLLFLVVAWSAACGDLVALPLGALVGSFVMQCHILYALPVVAVGLVAVAAFVFGDRLVRDRTDRADRADRDDNDRSRRRSLVAAAVVLAGCWWTAIYDQVVHRPGNLTRLWDSFSRSTQDRFGTVTALRYVVKTITVPPAFARRFENYSAYSSLNVRPGPWFTVGAVAVLGALILGTIVAWRRAAAETWLGVLAVATVGIVYFVLERLPIEYGGVDAYRGRFLWIISLYVWLALVLVVGRPIARSVVRSCARLWPALGSGRAAVAVSTVVALAALSAGALVAGERSPAYVVAPDDSSEIRSLSNQVRARVAYHGPYLLVAAGTRAFASIASGVMWDLVRHGYDIRLLAGDSYLGAAHGLPRRAKVPHLVVVSSGPGYRPPAHARRVAVLGTDSGLAERLRREEAAIVAGLEQRGAHLTATGRALAAKHYSGPIAYALRDLSAQFPPWHRLIHDQTLGVLVAGKFVAVAQRDAEALARFDRRLSDSTSAVLSVFVVPAPT